jgi:predicted ATPase
MPATLQGPNASVHSEALAAIFTLAARRHTLVIVLEDWHWVDGFDAVLQHLVELVPDYPLMIVLLCRPEYALD